MIAATRLKIFRIFAIGFAVIMGLSTLVDLTSLIARPGLQGTDVSTDSARTSGDASAMAALTSLDGDNRSNAMMIEAARVLDMPANTAERSKGNREAQRAAVSMLATSPVNSLSWTALGLLRVQNAEPATQMFKTSYLTGPVPRDAAVKRLRAIVATDAVGDEEVRLLALSDIRTMLTKYPKPEAALVATYRQANPRGKAFLLDAAAGVDARFGRLLRES